MQCVQSRDITRMADTSDYVDLSEYNIHVIWETTLRLWLAKLPFLAERAPPGLADSLEQRCRARQPRAIPPCRIAPRRPQLPFRASAVVLRAVSVSTSMTSASSYGKMATENRRSRRIAGTTPRLAVTPRLGATKRLAAGDVARRAGLATGVGVAS